MHILQMHFNKIRRRCKLGTISSLFFLFFRGRGGGQQGVSLLGMGGCGWSGGTVSVFVLFCFPRFGLSEYRESSSIFCFILISVFFPLFLRVAGGVILSRVSLT